MMAEREGLIKEWYERYGEDLYRSLRSAAKNPEEAQDISQETFLKVAMKLSDKECSETILNPKAFLYRVAFNEFYNRCKRRKLHNHLQQLFGESDEAYICSITPEKIALDQEELAVVRDAIYGLPDKQREVFLLTRVNNMSYQNAARKLGIKKDTVKKHVVRVLAALRVARAGYLNDEPKKPLDYEDG
ncbi:RNA polymerase sigma factor [Paremcibacter congregatus]|uniref:RNA polymerase subunit sigma-70 n=1 Tax=Paremcibacter congregatus TaxID=2043170 RepID=A0A2G4YQY6_9PROT|nr:RNA polymerase sigma factor [Paremcibacter congregatus]PHZ84742.1 hypothetical protein CRD36_10680 [Paremcibacter congregatus]QDE28935.1 RNA polymerase sigma factor [Paremcibacter congregatus]